MTEKVEGDKKNGADKATDPEKETIVVNAEGKNFLITPKNPTDETPEKAGNNKDQENNKPDF